VITRIRRDAAGSGESKEQAGGRGKGRACVNMTNENRRGEEAFSRNLASREASQRLSRRAWAVKCLFAFLGGSFGKRRFYPYWSQAGRPEGDYCFSGELYSCGICCITCFRPSFWCLFSSPSALGWAESGVGKSRWPRRYQVGREYKAQGRHLHGSQSTPSRRSTFSFSLHQ
jgi:hypothetical protein